MLAVLLVAGCGEPTPQAEAERVERPTNQQLFGEQLSQRGDISGSEEREAIQQFWRVWAKHKPVYQSKFLGVTTVQNPLDAWIVMRSSTKSPRT